MAEPGFEPGLSQHQACRGGAWGQLLWPGGGDCAKFLQLGDLSHVSLSFLSFLKTWTICQKKNQSFFSRVVRLPPSLGFQEHRFQSGSRTADFGRARLAPCTLRLSASILRTEAGTRGLEAPSKGSSSHPNPVFCRRRNGDPE